MSAAARAAEPVRYRRPLVFAHRGASHAEPEHTLGAYLRAIDEGADGLECDVRLTRDGHLVCVHDRRLERTSNGRGLVSTHTLAELNRLDFGSWHALRRAGESRREDEPMFQSPPGTGGPARILTLNALLDAALAAERPMRLLIETKHPTRYGPAVEARLVRALRQHGLDEPGPDDRVRVTVMSFSAFAVRRMRRLAPRLPTVMLMELLPPGLRVGRLPFGASIAGPGIGLLRANPEFADRLHARGYPVYVWTVNTLHDLKVAVGAGVEGVITDRPEYIRRQLDALVGP